MKKNWVDAELKVLEITDTAGGLNNIELKDGPQYTDGNKWYQDWGEAELSE